MHLERTLLLSIRKGDLPLLIAGFCFSSLAKLQAIPKNIVRRDGQVGRFNLFK